MSFLFAMLIALAIDAAIGWPARLHALVGHPVTWLGALIYRLDGAWNRDGASARARRGAGLAAVLVTVAIATLPALAVQWLLPATWIGTVATGILAWPLVAARAMHEHVDAVHRPLAAGDLPGARGAVAMIVGRDPRQLDEAGITRAAIESLAENTSDGIVAPLFWGAVAGLPGIAAYKAINTLDSMIGHRTARHAAFGWAAARIDDVVNLLPARLTGLLFALGSGRAGAALACMRADARRHRSPNAGWPEAAMAGALAIRLSGPRAYGGGIADEPWVNGTAPDPSPRDLHRALALFRRAMYLTAAGLAAAALATGW